MRIVLITGSRKWTDEAPIFEVILREFTAAVDAKEFFLLVHGDCETGADRLAENVCRRYNIHSARIAARWAIGRAAGPIRNQIMAELRPYKAFAFLMPNEPNRGTLDCIRALRHIGIEAERIEPSAPER